MDRRAVYCHLYALNESLFGQSRAQLDGMLDEMGVSLHINFSHCYLLLTGIRRQVYNQRFQMNRTDFSIIYEELKGHLAQIALEEELDCETGVLNYDYSKRIVIIFSPRNARFSPLAVAERISQRLEAQYRRMIPQCGPYFSNIMVVSDPIASFEAYQQAFRSLVALYRLSFFHRTGRPLTGKNMAARRVPYSQVDVERGLDEIEDALYQHDAARADRLLRDLFLGGLKASQDFDLLIDALAGLKRRLYDVSLILGLTPDDDAQINVRLETYMCIEELHDHLSACLKRHLAPQALTCPGRLSIQAATYIRQNYFRSIGLGDIAEHLHVNAAYLSRTFKQEMGVGANQYTQRLRVEQAMRLLRDTNLKVGEVARRVGLEDANYFSILFRRYAILSPQEYRARMAREKAERSLKPKD